MTVSLPTNYTFHIRSNGLILSLPSLFRDTRNEFSNRCHSIQILPIFLSFAWCGDSVCSCVAHPGVKSSTNENAPNEPSESKNESKSEMERSDWSNQSQTSQKLRLKLSVLIGRPNRRRVQRRRQIIWFSPSQDDDQFQVLHQEFDKLLNCDFPLSPGCPNDDFPDLNLGQTQNLVPKVVELKKQSPHTHEHNVSRSNAPRQHPKSSRKSRKRKSRKRKSRKRKSDTQTLGEQRRTKWRRGANDMKMKRGIYQVRVERRKIRVVAEEMNMNERALRRYVHISMDPTKQHSGYYMPLQPGEKVPKHLREIIKRSNL